MDTTLLYGFVLGVGLIPVGWMLKMLMSVEVASETSAVVTKFGIVNRVIEEPGLHWLVDRVLPWVKVIAVSKQMDFREYRGISVNDSRGTTIVVDLWAEFKITDPRKALFQVENWEESFQSLLFHSATSILGTREFKDILANRTELGNLICEDICEETARWGVDVDMVYVSKLSLLPEVSSQMYQAVSAQLSQAKMWIEENGRIRVAMLQAGTEAEVASLVAEARAQYPLAVSKAYQEVGGEPEVLAAYKELHRLSLIQPQRAIAFRGFGSKDISALDAAMLVPQALEGVTSHDIANKLNALAYSAHEGKQIT